jgi:HK97 family phage major capsid protein
MNTVGIAFNEAEEVRRLMANGDSSPVAELKARRAVQSQFRGRGFSAPPADIPFSHYGSLKHFTLPFEGPDKNGNRVKRSAQEQAFRFGQWFKGHIVGPVASMAGGMELAESCQKSVAWCKRNGVEIKAAYEGQNATGGALVPEEFDAQLIQLREKYGVARRNAKIVPMTSDTKTTPRRTSGLTVYNPDENTSITDSRKGWDSVVLHTKKFAVLTYYSSELADDVLMNLADDLAFEVAWAFSLQEDECFFLGDGTSTYFHIKGIAPTLLGLSSTIADIAGLHVGPTGTASSNTGYTIADFTATAGLLPNYADNGNAKWYAHRSFYFNTMLDVALKAGGVYAQEVLGSMISGQPQFMGYPVEYVQVMPQTPAASQIMAIFGDLTLGSRLGDRKQTTIAIDASIGFANDQLAMRGIERLDINIHDVGNASGTASQLQPGPIVALISAAS